MPKFRKPTVKETRILALMDDGKSTIIARWRAPSSTSKTFISMYKRGWIEPLDENMLKSCANQQQMYYVHWQITDAGLAIYDHAYVVTVPSRIPRVPDNYVVYYWNLEKRQWQQHHDGDVWSYSDKAVAQQVVESINKARKGE